MNEIRSSCCEKISKVDKTFVRLMAEREIERLKQRTREIISIRNETITSL